jgi:hypothetical protein
MRTLKEYANAVAAKVTGESLATVQSVSDGNFSATDANQAQFGLDLSKLLDFVGQIVSLLQNCPLSSRDAAKAASKPSWKQKVQFKAQARQLAREQTDFSFRDRHALVCDCCETVNSTMTVDDLAAVIDDARTPDYQVL